MWRFNVLMGRLCDERGRKQTISYLTWTLVVAGCLVALTAASLASPPVQDTGLSSLDEHSNVLIWTLATLVVILFSAAVGLVIWNITDMKESNRAYAVTTEKALGEIRSEVGSLEDKHDGDLTHVNGRVDELRGVVMQMRPEHDNLLRLGEEIQALRGMLLETRKTVIEVKTEHDVYRKQCKEG